MTFDELLPEGVRATIPAPGETARERYPLLRVKLFYPDFSWTWYIIEFDGEDICHGYVEGFENEYGSFSIRELLATRGQLGCEIERDEFFTPCRVPDLHKHKGPATSGAPLVTIQSHL
jgi:hypothetical protein